MPVYLAPLSPANEAVVEAALVGALGAESVSTVIDAGGLMIYTANGPENYRRAATYVDKADVPSTARAKPKEARIKITIPRKDIYEAG